jgi:hypothetical protein
MAVLEGVSFERDLGFFMRGAIDARKPVVRTDGFYMCLWRSSVWLTIATSRDPITPTRPRSCRGVTRSSQTSRPGSMEPSRGVSKKHMPRYLDEFIYRFNRRRRENELSGFVLTRAVRAHPFPYSRLTAELIG